MGDSRSYWYGLACMRILQHWPEMYRETGRFLERIEAGTVAG